VFELALPSPDHISSSANFSLHFPSPNILAYYTLELTLQVLLSRTQYLLARTPNLFSRTPNMLVGTLDILVRMPYLLDRTPDMLFINI
jgi:hypothetical protein